MSLIYNGTSINGLVSHPNQGTNQMKLNYGGSDVTCKCVIVHKRNEDMVYEGFSSSDIEIMPSSYLAQSTGASVSWSNFTVNSRTISPSNTLQFYWNIQDYTTYRYLFHVIIYLNKVQAGGTSWTDVLDMVIETGKVSSISYGWCCLGYGIQHKSMSTNNSQWVLFHPLPIGQMNPFINVGANFPNCITLDSCLSASSTWRVEKARYIPL